MVQASQELLDWMRDFGFKKGSIKAVAQLEFDSPPSVAVAQTNVAALNRILHMKCNQVRPACAPHALLLGARPLP